MSISPERLDELKKIKSNLEEIDYSDIPKLTKEQMAQMKPCHMVNREYWKPKKKVLNVRIDADILDSLRNSGEGWQTRLNNLLREAITNKSI